MLFHKAINNCCTKQTIYLINKCYNYSIKFNLDKAFHVLPAADAKVVQNSLSFSKRIWSAIRFLQGGRQSQSDILCVHHSS